MNRNSGRSLFSDSKLYNRNNKYIFSLLASIFIVTTGCSGGGGSSTTTTTDTVEISTSTASVAESGSTVDITVTRTGTGAGAATVDYASADGTATTAGSDYTAASGTLSWVDGDTASKTITVTITDDSAAEFSETLTVSISNPSNATLGSGTSSTITITDNDSISVSGTVSAPGASLAFNGPGFFERMLASVFGNAIAALSDIVSPVPDATVAVYQVDASGAVVGSAITTATTDSSGNFTLVAPTALTGSESAYIVRATGTTGTLDSRVTSTSDLAVDPTTDATSDLIASITSDLSTITATEITEINETVSDLLSNVTVSSVTATDLAASLVTEVNKDEESLKVISSTSASGTICGTVTDSANAGIENVLVIVRDYGDWVTRAKTKTDSNGDYCLNVPITGDTDPFTGNAVSGDYIVGAINRTGNTVNPLKSASEWYTASGGARTQFGSDKVTVANTTALDIDFQLADGARISGTVTTHDSGSAEDIKIEVRDYDTFVPVAWAKVKADGTYRVSVPAGAGNDYIIMAVNKTLLRAYATTVYSSIGAASAYTHARESAERISLTVGGGKTADFTLQAGNMLSGTVLDAPSGTAVQGVRVRVDLPGDANFGGTAARLRTRKDGTYRIWLKPDSYYVRSRGQGPTLVDLSSGNVANTDFDAQQGTITGILQDGNSNPVSQAKLFLYTVDTTSPTSYVYTLVSQELSNSDGTFEMYATTGAAYKLLARFDEPTTYASVVYTSTGGTDTINGGDNISVTTGVNTDLSTITLPTQTVTGGAGAVANGAGVLTGTVSANGTSGIAGGQLIEVRATATNNTARFLTARTRGDGSYAVPLPVSSTYRVRFIGTTNVDGVAITDGNTTTQDQ